MAEFVTELLKELKAPRQPALVTFIDVSSKLTGISQISCAHESLLNACSLISGIL